jgi:hypothetical protein
MSCVVLWSNRARIVLVRFLAQDRISTTPKPLFILRPTKIQSGQTCCARIFRVLMEISWLFLGWTFLKHAYFSRIHRRAAYHCIKKENLHIFQTCLWLLESWNLYNLCEAKVKLAKTWNLGLKVYWSLNFKTFICFLLSCWKERRWKYTCHPAHVLCGTRDGNIILIMPILKSSDNGKVTFVTVRYRVLSNVVNFP